MENYIIESASLSQTDALMDFYTKDERESLPIPAYANLKEALQKQSLLTARSENGIIAATAGYFEYARSDETRMIYELAGTRVKNNIGRLTGFSLQQILISLRVIQIAATKISTFWEWKRLLQCRNGLNLTPAAGRGLRNGRNGNISLQRRTPSTGRWEY